MRAALTLLPASSRPLPRDRRSRGSRSVEELAAGAGRCRTGVALACSARSPLRARSSPAPALAVRALRAEGTVAAVQPSPPAIALPRSCHSRSRPAAPRCRRSERCRHLRIQRRRPRRAESPAARAGSERAAAWAMSISGCTAKNEPIVTTTQRATPMPGAATSRGGEPPAGRAAARRGRAEVHRAHDAEVVVERDQRGERRRRSISHNQPRSYAAEKT